MKKLFVISSFVVSLFLFTTPSFAASPDGLGPWADNVFSTSQGLMKNGLAVPALRSDTSAALGVAENNTVDAIFYSLGFGGNIILGFDNGISSGVFIVEATNPDYPLETAKVEISENGTTWITAGNVTQDGSVSVPEEIACAKFVRITDISDPAVMPDDIADGYDVDGVQAIGDSCTPAATPTPTPSSTPIPSPTFSPTTGESRTSPEGSTATPGPGFPNTGTTSPGFPNTGTITTTSPGFPDTGNRLVPRLPNTGFGPENQNTLWIILGAGLLSCLIFGLTFKVFSSRR